MTNKWKYLGFASSCRLCYSWGWSFVM